MVSKLGEAVTQVRRAVLGRGGPPVAEMLLAAAEAGTEARLITDADGAFVYANPAFLRLFVMATSLDAVAAICANDGARAALARLRTAGGDGTDASAEVALTVRPGAEEWRAMSVQSVPGWPGYALWTADDITRRREADAQRRREDAVLGDYIDGLPAGFFSADAEGRIVHANQTLAHWLGIEVADLGRGDVAFADFVAAVEPAPEQDDTAGVHGEVVLRAADGETFRAALIQSERHGTDGSTLYTRSLVVRGLTWLADADAVRTAERRLRWLFSEAPGGIAIVDLAGTVVDCNRALLKSLGLHRDAVVGRPFAERVSKADRDDIAGQLSKVVMATMRAAHLEGVRVPGAGDRELSASISASRIEDADGDVSGLIVHFMDTTEHRDLEVQFAQSQKMQAVGQLAGGIAHDFNNLLTAMLGFCDLLLTRHGAGDPSFADIMQIRQNANRATNLVRQLLAFSRKQTLQPVILDVNEALGDLSHLLGRLLGETVTLVMESGDDLGLVRVDPGQFDQVIINLAVNARDAMPGGGTLTIRTALALTEQPVSRGPEVMPPGRYVLIEVADTGVGIPKEVIGSIFEPFFSTKDTGAGTGLGLSTVYGIVRQTEGFVSVDSAPGQGTTFSIHLPAIGADEAEDGVAVHAAIPHVDASMGDLTGAGTVLLVEDEDAVRMFAARALRAKGYQVLEARDGEGALDVVNGTNGPIDLIVSDVVMPGMDGHTLVKLVRHEIEGIKVILMSGYAEEVLGDELTAEPWIHFLPKPFTLADLAGKVKEVLDAGR